MAYWLLYDVPETKKRLKIIQKCKDFGLQRIQKSCFFGEMTAEKVAEFECEIQKLVGDEDSVCLIPVSPKAVEQTMVWGGFSFNPESAGEELCFI